MGIGIRLAAGTLVIAALCVTVAAGAMDVPENCRNLAERYIRAPDQATLATLEACLGGKQADARNVNTSPSTPASQPKRARGEWRQAEPWVHTSESWPPQSW